LGPVIASSADSSSADQPCSQGGSTKAAEPTAVQQSPESSRSLTTTSEQSEPRHSVQSFQATQTAWNANGRAKRGERLEGRVRSGASPVALWLAGYFRAVESWDDILQHQTVSRPVLVKQPACRSPSEPFKHNAQISIMPGDSAWGLSPRPAKVSIQYLQHQSPWSLHGCQAIFDPSRLASAGTFP